MWAIAISSTILNVLIEVFHCLRSIVSQRIWQSTCWYPKGGNIEMDINENIVSSCSSLLRACLGKKNFGSLLSRVELGNWWKKKKLDGWWMVTISNFYKQTCGHGHLGKKNVWPLFQRGQCGVAGQRADHRRDQREVTKPPQQAAHHIAPNFFTPSKAEEPEEEWKGKRKAEKSGGRWRRKRFLSVGGGSLSVAALCPRRLQASESWRAREGTWFSSKKKIPQISVAEKLSQLSQSWISLWGK